MDKYKVSKYPSFPSFRDSFVRVVGILRGLGLYKAFSSVLGFVIVFHSVSFLLANKHDFEKI